MECCPVLAVVASVSITSASHAENATPPANSPAVSEAPPVGPRGTHTVDLYQVEALCPEELSAMLHERELLHGHDVLADVGGDAVRMERADQAIALHASSRIRSTINFDEP